MELVGRYGTSNDKFSQPIFFFGVCLYVRDVASKERKVTGGPVARQSRPNK